MKFSDILQIEPNKKEKIKCLKLPQRLSVELAYLSGVLAGDGSINIRESKHEYLIKCVGNPRDEKEFYHKIISPYFFNLFNLRLKVKHQDARTTYGFIIYSKTLVRFFTEAVGLPFGKKYSNLKIPPLFKKDRQFVLWFIRGLIDTDSCITFKRRHRSFPYYPVISFSSKSKRLTKEISKFLKTQDFKVVEMYDYKTDDNRFKRGYSVINRLELNGVDNFNRWMQIIGFRSPKHIKRIKKYWRGHSEGWI